MVLVRVRRALYAALVFASVGLAACGGQSTASSSPTDSSASGSGGGSSGSDGVAASSTVTLASPSTVVQTAGSVLFTISRSGITNQSASVSYATHDGTAVAGTNYTASQGTLTWAAGDTSAKTFSVPLSSTAFVGTKTFSASLTAGTGATLGSPSSSTVTLSGSGGSSPPGLAAALAAKLGKPARLLVGLGGQGTTDRIAAIQSQGLKIDIYESYLGTGDWTSWNSPPCDYVCVVGQQADSVGAIPMYTQYQMANDGDGNISVINDASFMATYWSRVRLLFQDIAAYNKPVLVNFEPDFWGYAERAAANADPTKLTAVVSTNPDCSGLPNDVTGIARCLLAMARQYAPKAYVGFPPSSWGGDTDADVVAFMNAVGAQNADFIVEQTLDRDAGCFEVTPQPSYCARSGSGWYWDESNQTHPNFTDHLTQAKNYHTGIGGLPLIWWQTPQGVPSTAAGGTAYHYRDNREHYFLTHPAELVAAGGLGVVFSTGENHQTNVTTDGGQFQTLSGDYAASPAPLP